MSHREGCNGVPLPAGGACRPGRGAVYAAPIPSAVPHVVGEVRTTAADRLPAVDGLRGLCAVAIVAFHTATFTGPFPAAYPSGASLSAWIAHLDVAVGVFFVLSGYLLTRPFLVARDLGADGPDPAVFLRRRARRLLPAYWLALGVSAVLVPGLIPGWSVAVRLALLVQTYWSDSAFAGLIQAWTLCTEASFILVVALWAGSTRRRRSRPAATAVGAVVLIGLGWTARVELRRRDAQLGFTWLPVTADLFAVGVLLAAAEVAARRAGSPADRWVARWRAMPAVGWVLAVVCCGVAIVMLQLPAGLVPPSPGRDLAREVLVAVIGALAVGAVALPGPDGGPRLLRVRVMRWLGRRSYGIYLWHLTVLLVVARHRPGWLTDPGDTRVRWVVASAVVVMVAAVTGAAADRMVDRVVDLVGARRGANPVVSNMS